MILSLKKCRFNNARESNIPFSYSAVIKTDIIFYLLDPPPKTCYNSGMEETQELTLKQLSSQHFVPIGWYQDTFRDDFFMEWHNHQQFEIMYCEKGAFVFAYMTEKDGQTVERVAIPEKYFIFVNTGYYHRIEIEIDKTQIYNVELLPENGFAAEDSKFLKSISPSIRDLFSSDAHLEKLREKDAPFYLFHDSGNVGQTMKLLVDELVTSSEPKRNLSARLLILKLLLDISKCYSDKSLQPIKLGYVRKAVQYMQMNFARPLSVDEIAGSVGISGAYLQRLFKAEFKEGIHGMLTSIRVKNAKNLLKTTSLPNQEIAKLSGFTSREQLIYSFRNLEGCSPHEYRLACHTKIMRTYPWPADTKLSEN